MATETGRIDQDLPAMEAHYWQNTQTIRAREDAKLAHEHNTRVERLDRGLNDLYTKRSNLRNLLDEINTTIQDQTVERARLAREYEARMTQLVSERQDEDRTQKTWFIRARKVSLPGRESATPNGHTSLANQEPPFPDSTGSWTSINSALRRSSRVQEQREHRRDPGNLFGSVFHNPVDEAAPSSSHPLPLRSNSGPLRPDRDLLTPMESRTGTVVHTARNTTILGEMANGSPEEDIKRSSRGRKSLPSLRDVVSQMNSPASESAATNDAEITHDSLILKYDGNTIVYPPMYAGVPMEKIDEKHPFWNPEWEPLEVTIQAQLDKWKEKLEGLRRKPDVVRHTMFLANRQVNRGQAVLDFLRGGCFHPLQFASRDLMDKFYKTFINYDTVFRLVNVHEELKKFDLDVTPLEWLRHRLHEVSVQQGDKFSLSKTTHDLYHDDKLKYLREKHGFGHIGRPSGYKLGGGDRNRSAAKIKPKRESIETSGEGEGEGEGEIKTSSRRSFDQFDADDEPLRHTGAANEVLEPVTPRLKKRARVGTAEVKQEDEGVPDQGWEVVLADLECDGYSSRDSFSNGRIMHLDFRVGQIKAKTLMTRPNVTQYWTWKPEESKFEHQVLGDVDPITWSYYRQSHTFSCKVEEMKQIRYASDSLMVWIARADEEKGDIFAVFKRERTKRRFLTFIKKRGIRLVKSSPSQLEEAWNAMKSELMSEGDGEPKAKLDDP